MQPQSCESTTEAKESLSRSEAQLVRESRFPSALVGCGCLKGV